MQETEHRKAYGEKFKITLYWDKNVGENQLLTKKNPSCSLRKTRGFCPGWKMRDTFLRECKNPSLESVSAICILSNMNPV